jgi:hypothetical protein
MANIEVKSDPGSVREKEKKTTSYRANYPTFSAGTSHPAVYQITGLRDEFNLERKGGMEVVYQDMDFSYSDVTFQERFRIAVTALFPKIAEFFYGTKLQKTDFLPDEELANLQPEIDAYNTKCGQANEADNCLVVRKTERVLRTDDESLVDKL